MSGFFVAKVKMFSDVSRKSASKSFQKKGCVPGDSKWPFWDGENVTLLRGCWWPPTIGDQVWSRLESPGSSYFNWTNQFQSTPVFPTLFWGFLTWPWELPEATDAACRKMSRPADGVPPLNFPERLEPWKRIIIIWTIHLTTFEFQPVHFPGFFDFDRKKSSKCY